MNCTPALVCLLVAMAAFSPALTAAPDPPEQPVPSEVFVDSAGINVRLGYAGTLYYDDFPLIEASLKRLGIHHVRDLLSSSSSPSYYQRYTQLGLDGIQGLFTTEGTESTETLQQWPLNVGTAFEAYEAPNEFDNNNNPRWAPQLRAFLPILYSAARTGAAPLSIVVGPSMVHTPSYAQLGNVSAYQNVGSMHNYHDGRNPGTPGWWGGPGYADYGSTPWNQLVDSILSGTQQVWSTETGYTTDLRVQGAVSESVAALYIPRVYLMGWLYGSTRTYLLELMSGSDGEFGLLRADGSAKPAFGAVANLLSVLADPGPAFTPAPLSYSITGGQDGLKHLLLQKRNGAYYLALWVELPVYDVNAMSPIQVPAQPLVVHVDHPLQAATSYQLDGAGGLTVTNLDAAADLGVSASPAVNIVKLQLDNVQHIGVQLSPQGAGTVALDPASADGYYTTGQTVMLAAMAGPGYRFSGFTGDLSSPVSPLSVLASRSYNLVANFLCSYSGQWTTGGSHTTLQVPQPAGAASIAIAAGSTCAWTPVSSSPWITVSPAGAPIGNGTVTVTYSSNPGVARTGQVEVAGTVYTLTQAAAFSVLVSLTTDTNYGTISPSGVIAGHVLTHNAPALVTVDGALVTTPATLTWNVGSVHTLGAVQPQFVLGQPYVGEGWTPGESPGLSANTITVTVSPATTAFEQDLISSALLTTSVIGAGTLSITPSPGPTGGYYILDQVVTIHATPNAGCSFTRFSGAFNSSSPSISFSMNRAVALDAVFSCP